MQHKKSLLFFSTKKKLIDKWLFDSLMLFRIDAILIQMKF